MPAVRQRLDSWKEIAAYFGRDERTVNRWEKDLGLPVHRLPGRAKGPVYAYTDELAAWMARPHQDEPLVAAPAPTERPEGLLQAQSAATASLVPAFVRATEPLTEGGLGRAATGWFVAGGMLTVACILGWVLLHGLTASGSPSKFRTQAKVGSSGGSVGGGSVGIVQASTPPHNPEAEQLYLQGRYYWTKRTPEDLTRAVDYFTQAIVKDPSYSNAYVGLADCYNLLREYTLMPASEAYPRALAAAQKAVELDDQSSSAHASVAFASFWGKWDFATADREFQRAIELDPNNAVAHHWYATYLGMLRRVPEALAEIDRAQALDPSSTSILADKGDLLLIAGRTDESLALLGKMEATEPKFISAPRYLKNVYYLKADYPNYLAEWGKEAALLHDPSSLALVSAAGKGFATGGVHGMLSSTLRLQQKLYSQHLASPYDVARTCSMAGNRREAFQYLHVAYDRHDDALVALEADPAFDGLRDDAGYRELVARMNFPGN